MKTLISLQKKVYSTNLIIYLLCVILFSGCSKDDDSTDNTPSHIGVYTLTSILSNFQLDPNNNGQFDDTELIDNLSCISSITLDTNNTFTWDFLRVRQNSTDLLGVITSYDPISCSIIANVIGQFEIDETLISFEPLTNATTASINENSIEIIIREELIVDEGPILKKQFVNLTLTYEK